MDFLNNFEIREFKYNDNHEIIYENLNMIGKYLDLVIVNNKKSDYTYSISSPKINSDIKELSEKIAPELIKIIKSFGESKEYVQIIAMSLRILSSLVNLNHNLMISIEKDNHFPLIAKLLAHPTDYSIKFQALLLLKIAEPHYQKKVVQLLYNQENIQHLRSIFENENYKNDYSKLFFLTLASILDKKNNIQPKGYYLGHFISLYRYNLMYAIYCENLDMKFLERFTILLFVCNNKAHGFTYPSEGVYIGVNSNFISTIANQFTSLFENQINQYKIADISGSQGDDKYDFSSIQQSVQLGDFYFSETASEQYQIGFQSITFTINTDFKACVHKGEEIDLCEHGHVTINSQTTLSSTSDITISFSQSSPTITCSSTTLNVPSNGINYDVHCTSRICDKTHDITNAIEQQFVPQVQTSVTTAINAMISKYELFFQPLRNLNLNIKDNQLYLNSQGYLVQSNISQSLTPTIIYAINGGIVLKNSAGQLIYPSQSPSFLPNYQSVENFETDISVVLAPFFFESLLDTAFETLLPFEITDSMIPLDSPVHLNTSDPFFNQTAPGLTAKYPNSLIQVIINSPSSPPTISINSTGILVSSDLNVDFYVDSNIQVFSIGFSFYLELAPKITQVSDGFNITASIINLETFAAVTQSTIGDVDTTGFIQIIQLIQGSINLPNLHFSVPLTGYSISSLSFSNNYQFIQILLNLQQSQSQLQSKNNIIIKN